MTEEQALTLANEDGPAYLPGALNSLWDHCQPFPASQRHSAPARAWVGASTKIGSFMNAKSSFAPGEIKAVAPESVIQIQ